MIADFSFYMDQNMVKKTMPDPEEAGSLIRKAFERTTFVFEDAYESAREAVQSLMAMKGYKPYSHEAIFLPKIKREFDKL